jgi:hypothetical protein
MYIQSLAALQLIILAKSLSLGHYPLKCFVHINNINKVYHSFIHPNRKNETSDIINFVPHINTCYRISIRTVYPIADGS